MARKTPPKDAGAFIAAAIAGSWHPIQRAFQYSHPMGREMFGVERPAYAKPDPLQAVIDKAGPARAQVITLGLILAGRGRVRSAHLEAPRGSVHRLPDRDHQLGLRAE